MSGYELNRERPPPPHPDDAGARITCPQCDTIGSVRTVLQGDCCAQAAIDEAAAQSSWRRSSAVSGNSSSGRKVQRGGSKRRGPPPTPAEREAGRRRRRKAARDNELLQSNVFFPSQREERFHAQRLNELAVPNQARKTAKVVTSGFAKSELELLLLEKAQVPGPDAYDLPDGIAAMPGGKFSLANAKTDLDWAVLRAGQQPGPGAHDLPPERIGGAVNLGCARSKSALELMLLEAEKVPGPGAHSLPDITGSPLPGGRFPSGAKPKSDVEWSILRAAGMPGPADSGTRLEFGKGGVESPVHGGKFGGGNVKSSLEAAMEEARHKPGPGRYDVDASHSIGGAPNLGCARAKTALELMLLESAKIPGPAAYSPARHDAITGGAFSRGLHSEDAHTASPGPAVYSLPSLICTRSVGGKISDAHPKSELDWACLRAAKQPGPADYSLSSSFTVMEVSPIKTKRNKLPAVS